MALKRAFAARDLDYDFFDLFLQKQELSKGQLARTRAAAFDDMVVPSDDDDDAVDANDFFRSVLAVYDRIFSVTEEEQKTVSALDQHDRTTGEANPKWLEARIGRLTGSSIAAIIGLNPYESAEDFIRNKFWRTFKGNDATRYGNKYEDSCQNALEIVMHRRLKTFAGKRSQVSKYKTPACTFICEKNTWPYRRMGCSFFALKMGRRCVCCSNTSALTRNENSSRLYELFSKKRIKTFDRRSTRISGPPDLIE